MLRIDLKIIRTRMAKNRVRRSETTVSIPLVDHPPLDVLKAIWAFEQAVNSHSPVRVHLNVVDEHSPTDK